MLSYRQPLEMLPKLLRLHLPRTHNQPSWSPQKSHRLTHSNRLRYYTQKHVFYIYTLNQMFWGFFLLSCVITRVTTYALNILIHNFNIIQTLFVFSSFFLFFLFFASGSLFLLSFTYLSVLWWPNSGVMRYCLSSVVSCSPSYCVE